MNKRAIPLFFIALLAVSSLIMVESAHAQSIPKPSVPEFVLKFVPSSYNLTSTNPYTGEKVTEQVENNTIEVVIRNQLFASSFGGTNYYLFYNVRVKGHFSEEWNTLYYYQNWSKSSEFSPNWLSANKYSEYTVASVQANYPSRAQLDFQVEAVTMYDGQVRVYSNLGDFTGHFDPAYVLGETSGWSKTQTLTLAAPLPIVTILSPQEGNFSNSNVLLNFTVDQPVSRIEYSLDGQDNVTISGNTTLSGLANGIHNVIVYVSDEAGNTGASVAIVFIVNASETFPLVSVVAAILVGVVILAAGLLLYNRKRRKEAQQK